MNSIANLNELPEIMTGKIIDSGAPVALALIVPIALVLVVLYTAWPFILLVIALMIGWKIWENYQWQKLSQKVNPFFNQLVKENQGCLTQTDLSIKANLSAAVAKQFLEKKSEEYGAQRQHLNNKGTVYYFLTASAIGSMFEDSETLTNSESEELTPQKYKSSIVDLEPSESQPLASEIAQLVDLEPDRNVTKEQESQQFSHQSVDNLAASEKSDPEQKESIASQYSSVSDLDSSSESSQPESTSENLDRITHQSLIQAELAKRLALNSSTVGRRKSDPDFPEWSKSKDPESIAWKYVPKTKMFVPVDI